MRRMSYHKENTSVMGIKVIFQAYTLMESGVEATKSLEDISKLQRENIIRIKAPEYKDALDNTIMMVPSN